MYQVANNRAYIDGSKGYYDGKVLNPSVRYGRNAIDNYKNYLADFSYDAGNSSDTFESNKKTKKLIKNPIDAIKQLFYKKNPPEGYNNRYTPYETNYRFLDKFALMGSAYEQMDENISMPTSEFTKRLQAMSDANWGEGEIILDGEVLDLNRDGKIDLAEYSASIILEDALSKDEIFDEHNVTGCVTEKGEDRAIDYFEPYNYTNSRITFKKIYRTFHLEKAQERFLADKNNLVS